VNLVGGEGTPRGAAEITRARQLPHQLGSVHGETRPRQTLPLR
jgi:hypothetical protein